MKELNLHDIGGKGFQTDQYLLEMLKNDSYEAFKIIFNKYYTPLCTYSYRFIDLEDAEEIAQDIMVWLWENRHTVNISSSLSQYLFKTTYNRTLDAIDKKNVKLRSETKYYQQNINEWSDFIPLHLDEMKKSINTAIENLPKLYKDAFVMHRFDGRSYKDIANILNVSPKTIDYRIQQSLKILKVALHDYLL